MAFIKHVGKHSDRKVAIVFRKVPGEDHMALVVYMETLPSNFHDAIINTIESNAGQSVSELAEALDRAVLNDGRNLLQAIHAEKYLKKVQTNQVIVTPNTKNHVRLDELNRVLDKAVNLRNMLKSPDRMKKTIKYIVNHYRQNVEPLGYKAFIVAVDREACCLYKQELDKIFPKEESAVVISKNYNTPELADY